VAQGLLIEEQRTNLLTYSEQFDNAAWTKFQSSITANAATAPDGTLTADKEIPANGVAGTYIAQGFSATSGTTYTYTVYAKASEFSELRLLGESGAFGSNNTGVYNLSTGVASVAAGSPTVSMTSVGNGWWRCVWTATATATTTGAVQQRINTTGDGTSGLFIWGAQLEAGAFATSYIPTTTAATTRSADIASIGTLSPWFNTSTSSLYAEFVWEGLKSVAGQRIAIIDDGSTNNYFGLVGTSSNTMQNPVVVAGSTEAANSTPSTVYSANTVYKQAMALALNNTVGAINGVAGTTDTAVTVPTGLTTLRMAASSSVVTSNIWFRRITYTPRRLTDAELQSLTS
jgi:hypothetical protein